MRWKIWLADRFSVMLVSTFPTYMRNMREFEQRWTKTGLPATYTMVHLTAKGMYNESQMENAGEA